ncbi:MAG: phage N-6-adenine-methyltransferase [Vibrio sp.]
MANDNWRTPPEPFHNLDREFNFVADMAADNDNHLCDLYFTEEDDSLSFEWAKEINAIVLGNQTKYVWCNPPYSNPLPWVKKAVEAQANGLGVVMLLNYDHSVTWFYEALKGVSEIRNIITDGTKIQNSASGRLAFLDCNGEPQNGNSKGQTILVFNPFKIGACITSYIPKSKLYQEES